MKKHNLNDPLVIDCSHGNSKKSIHKQKQIFEEIIKYKHPSLIGIMLESFLKEGYQKITSKLKYGLSITDPCIGWENTEKLILKAHYLHR